VIIYPVKRINFPEAVQRVVIPNADSYRQHEGIFKFQWSENKKITCLQQAGFFVPHRNDVAFFFLDTLYYQLASYPMTN